MHVTQGLFILLSPEINRTRHVIWGSNLTRQKSWIHCWISQKGILIANNKNQNSDIYFRNQQKWATNANVLGLKQTFAFLQKAIFPLGFSTRNVSRGTSQWWLICLCPHLPSNKQFFYAEIFFNNRKFTGEEEKCFPHEKLTTINFNYRLIKVNKVVQSQNFFPFDGSLNSNFIDETFHFKTYSSGTINAFMCLRNMSMGSLKCKFIVIGKAKAKDFILRWINLFLKHQSKEVLCKKKSSIVENFVHWMGAIIRHVG